MSKITPAQLDRFLTEQRPIIKGRRGRLLCKLNKHDWKSWYPIPEFECRRCGLRKRG